MTARARVVAFHLPQFHPTPDNDAWWGAGFTEWTNVTKARPRFPGHRQPVLPGELGFYDLRLPEVREAQADLAREHGVEAFCYWHYWFGGRRVLERPVQEILASGEPDLPFCLAWANETWTRRWVGGDPTLLVEQTYSEADDLAHAAHLVEAFRDPRYLRVHGRPVFLVYRASAHEDPVRFVDALRRACADEGVEDPLLVAVDAHDRTADYRSLGFDEVLHFAPQLGSLPYALAPGFSRGRALRNLRRGHLSGRRRVYTYAEACRRTAADRPPGSIPCVFVGWDNSPRREADAVVVTGSTPQAFAAELGRAVEEVSSKPEQERLVFVNAWNEWAEGNHLEPDRDHGRARLQALRRVVRGT